MGKAKKLKVSATAEKKHSGLADQIDGDTFAQPSARNKERYYQPEEEYVDSKLSRRILSQAMQQQQQLLSEQEQGGDSRQAAKTTPPPSNRLGDSDDESEDSSDDEAKRSLIGADDEEIHISAEDERTVQQFMPTDVKPRRVLADIIMERIREKETEINSKMSDTQSCVSVQDIDPRVKQMYESIGTVLSKYRTGKIPKAFKVIPQLQDWEQILYLTKPHGWSAAAMYRATRLFAANLSEKMAQRFYNLVLLPRIRDDIIFYKKLNPHLYLALKKALFKPAAFMKGFLLPLCESGNCTLREAVIVSSVLARCSVPVLHSSAALLKIAEMPYNGAASVFLRVLLDKKYALPYQVIDGLHSHFMRFHLDERKLPVLWHQALLTFVRRYSADMSDEQRELMIDLTNSQTHPKITAEIRCELLSVRSTNFRGGTVEALAEASPTVAAMEVSG